MPLQLLILDVMQVQAPLTLHHTRRLMCICDVSYKSTLSHAFMQVLLPSTLHDPTSQGTGGSATVVFEKMLAGEARFRSFPLVLLAHVLQ